MKLASSTGNWSSPSKKRCLCFMFDQYSEISTPSPHGPRRPTNTCTRRIRPSPVHSKPLTVPNPNLTLRFELGELPFKRNCSTDWARVKTAAISGDFDSIPEDIFVRHYQNLKRIRVDHMEPPPNLDAPTGIWIHGEPGVGKSYYARQLAPNAYIKPQNKWWDSYKGQEDVLLEDLDTEVLGHYIKIWADQYAFSAEMKGCSALIRPKRFIVTSNYLPEQLFKDPVMAQAVRRRFTFIHKRTLHQFDTT